MQLVLVKLLSRNVEAVKLQEVLTKHGCDISMRLGLHEAGEKDSCSNEGLIILQVKPDSKAVDSLVGDLQALAKVGGIVVKPISF